MLDRRAFVVESACACTAAGLALAGCSLSDSTGPNSIGASLQIADYPELATIGGVALVSLSGASLAIVRTGATTFDALSRICPHQGATVNPAGTGFMCPRHGAPFTRDGTWTGGQQTSNLRSYSTTYNATTGTLAIA